MKRALNNKEKATLKALKDKGYTPAVKEANGFFGVEYYAEVVELRSWISLSSPPDLNEIPDKNSSKPHKQCTCGQKYEECTTSPSDCHEFQYHKQQVNDLCKKQKS
jgi:hypothetical protein